MPAANKCAMAMLKQTLRIRVTVQVLQTYVQSAFDLSIVSQFYVYFLVQAQSYEVKRFFDSSVLLGHALGHNPDLCRLLCSCNRLVADGQSR